jgi:hypothetical protein
MSKLTELVVEVVLMLMLCAVIALCLNLGKYLFFLHKNCSTQRYTHHSVQYNRSSEYAKQ